ncbi:acyltransferase family protein [Rudanella lutea]|uniref:acyltransferase family protein n=1 Tax=Rudanella lutea TaxID=451374 RepID=UPI0003A51C9F|nr:heparan-alpha-glucosaminide N-acetyltransferase domain-containing protein [Rudanella lutea]
MISTSTNPPASGRLLSLDAFRGLTVAAMIMVNNAGDWTHIYAPLGHAEWNGWTPTDLIFPFFLFIVGVSITFALGGIKQKGDTGDATRKIVRRGLTLFALGLFLNFFPKFDPTNVRILGVLQRIGIVYIVCSFVFLRTDVRGQRLLAGALLLGYYLLMTLVPVPGVGYPNLEPTTNLSAWLDNLVLTPAHVYKSTKVWDPEGILSTLPAIATGLLGVLTGTWLRGNRPVAEKIAWLFSAGVLLTIAGLFADAFFPINKKIWTSSFVLLTGGLAMLGLATCYWLIDVVGPERPLYRRLSLPFVAYGVNAITVFFLSGLIPRIMNLVKVPGPDGGEVGLIEYLYRSFIAPFFSNPYNASLAGALTFVVIWGVILWIMYRRNIIVKV